MAKPNPLGYSSTPAVFGLPATQYFSLRLTAAVTAAYDGLRKLCVQRKRCSGSKKLWVQEEALGIGPRGKRAKAYLPLGSGKVLFNLGTDTILDVLIRSSIARNPRKETNAYDWNGLCLRGDCTDLPCVIQGHQADTRPLLPFSTGPCSPLMRDGLFCGNPLVLLHLHQPCDQVFGWGQSQGWARDGRPISLSRCDEWAGEQE